MALKSKQLASVRTDVPVAEVGKHPEVRINLNVPDELRRRWKMAAIELGSDMSTLIKEAMEVYLSTRLSK